MNWGSTQEEQAMALPGDTAPPSTYFTRAITINAPPSAVWPWLLAIGQDRAGFLSNDYLENLTGADIHNGDALRSEWRQRAIGDRVPMGSPGQQALFGPETLTTIHVLDPEQVIGDTPGWFVLLPQGRLQYTVALARIARRPAARRRRVGVVGPDAFRDGSASWRARTNPPRSAHERRAVSGADPVAHAPRQQRNQPFNLRLLDELVVVPVHTFVKVHGVAHEASSSTFGMWSHTFVRSPTQSFCAYVG
jgi:hypothetical protein